MRPTVNDIAREAGVSLATVDRVLNARTGVRDKTANRVMAAIDRLGYVRDVTAANLARQRQYRLCFLLPSGRTGFLRLLRDTIRAAAEEARRDRTDIGIVAYSARGPNGFVAALGALHAAEYDGVAIMAPETPEVRDAVRRLRAEGVAVVALVSDLPGAAADHFVGIDNIAAGRTAGFLLGRFAAPGPGRVMVLASSMTARDSVERRLGFDRVMAERFPHLRVLPTIEGHDDPPTIRAAIGRVLAGGDLAGVYALGSGTAAMLDALAAAGRPTAPVAVAHELTEANRLALLTGALDAVITQDVGHLVRSALRVLRAKSDNTAISAAQERIRIEVVVSENLPAELFAARAAPAPPAAPDGPPPARDAPAPPPASRAPAPGREVACAEGRPALRRPAPRPLQAKGPAT